MTDAAHRPAERPAENLEDPLEALLGDAVVYEHGEAPAPESVPVFDEPAERTAEVRSAAREPRVSPVFWAAAVVWNLPGGLGSWVLLHKTHPKTARRLLVLGIVSFVIIAGIIAAVIITDRALNPRYIYLTR